MKGSTQKLPYDPSAQTRPIPPQEHLGHYQPVRVPRTRPQRKPVGCWSCVLILIPLLLALLLFAFYLLAPFRTNFLVLGVDRVPDGTALGRTDTIILVSVDPLKPTVKMLSIPRDLWVPIPLAGVGENRINTAHFYAEAAQPGSGPQVTLRTVVQDFDVQVPYYVRIRFDAFQGIVDAMGGVSINLAQEMGGLPAGQHHLNGEQALAFVRDRKGTDDFFRMNQGQFMIKAVMQQMLSPLTWPRLPLIVEAVFASVDTNLPFWQWPRIGLALLRGSVSSSIDSRSILREMTVPYVTSGGANVLLPKWDLIHPYVQAMFAQ